MWKTNTVERGELAGFLNAMKIKPGEFAIVDASYAIQPGQAAWVEIVYFDKGAIK